MLWLRLPVLCAACYHLYNTSVWLIVWQSEGSSWLCVLSDARQATEAATTSGTNQTSTLFFILSFTVCNSSTGTWYQHFVFHSQLHCLYSFYRHLIPALCFSLSASLSVLVLQALDTSTLFFILSFIVCTSSTGTWCRHCQHPHWKHFCHVIVNTYGVTAV